MNTKPNIIAGLLIAVGLMLLGIFISSGIKSYKMMDRAVLVKGLSEIEVPANRVIWPITYTELGNDLTGIYSTVESKNSAIIKFLTDSGIPRAEITCSAPSVVDRQAEIYNNNQTPFRYNVTSVVTVSSEMVDKVRELMVKQTDLLKSGIAITTANWQFQTRFLFTRLNDVKPQMIEEATKNARVSAEKFAEDSQSKLGKIKTAQQGQVSIEDRDENTPYIKKLRVVTTVEYMLED